MVEIVEIKTLLLENCKLFIQKKEATILETISTAKTNLLSETKSSAGDKHETGRAMIQLEMEKASQQLVEVSTMKEVLNKILIEKESEIIKLGSIVITTKATYFLAISVGQVVINSIVYIIISTQSPIGKQLLGSKIGDTLPFNSAVIINIL